MRNHPVYVRWLAAAMVFASVGLAQSPFTQASIPTARENGWNIFGGTSSFGYSTFTVPADGTRGEIGPARRENDYDATASLSAGYSYVGLRNSFSIIYMPTLVRRVRYSKLHTLNQGLSLSLTRQLTPRWDLQLSGNVTDSSADQLMFVPAVVGFAPAAVDGLDDLLGAARTGQQTISDLTSTLASTPYVVRPSESLLYNTRSLNAAASLNLSYRPSVRLRVGMNLSMGRSETRDGLQDVLPSVSNAILPTLLSQQAGLSLSYSLTPRTALGVDAEGSYIDSSISRYFVQTARASISHNFTAHWFGSVRGGPAYVTPSSQTGLVTIAPLAHPRPSYSVQASAGYTNHQHSLMGSYGVAPTDTSGFNSHRTEIATLAWEWQPAGRPWAINLNAGHQSMSGGVLGDVQYWQGRANLVRFLGPQMAITFSYAYVGRPAIVSNVVGGSQDLSGFSGRISIVWTPRRRDRSGAEGTPSGGAGQGTGAGRSSS